MLQNDCLVCHLHKNWIKSIRMVIISYSLMFWSEIQLQPDRHVFIGNIAGKNVMIWPNFDSGSIFIFTFSFPIATL